MVSRRIVVRSEEWSKKILRRTCVSMLPSAAVVARRPCVELTVSRNFGKLEMRCRVVAEGEGVPQMALEDSISRAAVISGRRRCS